MTKIRDWIIDRCSTKKTIVFALIFALLSLVSLVLSFAIDRLFTGQSISFSTAAILASLGTPKVVKLFLLLLGFSALFVVYMIFNQQHLGSFSGCLRITPEIQIPHPAGNGQHGNAHFEKPARQGQIFKKYSTADIVSLNQSMRISSAGIYLGQSRNGCEHYCMDDDTHAIVLGTTGSGKTRCLVLQTICMLAMAGESMIIADPKSELMIYTMKLLKQLDYNIVALDFVSFRKSNQYNFLQPIIDAVNANDIALAITRTNDLVAALVSCDRTNESIWVDGERSIIACAVMAVVYDNIHKPQHQNLTNVYYFLANMCSANSRGEMPLKRYIRNLPDTHPAKALVHISNIAPDKMRGSFYTSALTTLYLFTSPDAYSMTCTTDFDIYNTASEKTAIFIILPDYKSTYYSVATLFISQQYLTLREGSYEQGGRLQRRVNFVLDEFGNFTKIPDFKKHITVGRGCGVRYMLFLQDFHQLRNTYGDDDSKTIRSNCETWVYLRSQDADTLKELSGKLGPYTIKAPSVSSGTNSSSSSYSLASRELLSASELVHIKRPYQLVIYNGQNCMMHSPDISKTVFNDLLGMGSKPHNIELFKQRNGSRPERPKITMDDIIIWKPWEKTYFKETYK